MYFLHADWNPGGCFVWKSKKVDETQMPYAIDLIWTTFLEFEAPDYSEEGIQSFKDFIENRKIIRTLEFWGAYENQELKGGYSYK